VELILGIDLACRAAHQASLAGPDGTFVWTGRKFFTRPAELEKLWKQIGLGEHDTLRVVMEPTRNAWAPVASWFRRRGARISMVPTTQSADLRAYYSKHTKNDHLDSKLLARLPLLHPEGLREHTGDGPAEPLRRVVKIRSSIVKRRTAVFQRLDALLELLGPAWYDALGSNYGKAALALLARYADPHSLIRVGHARLTRFLIRHSRGAWREQHATMLLAAAQESLQLWGSGAEAAIDFAELAADIAVEAQQAQMLTEQIEDLDERCANLYAEADPTGIIASAPGVGPVTCAVIAGRIGDPHRFHSLAAIRSYSGLVPKLSQSGQAQHQHGLTKAGDPLLREALFAAADQARKTDPQLAAKYKRLLATDLPHRHHAAHPHRHLLAHRRALQPARHRRPHHHTRTRTPNRPHPPRSRQADPHQSRQYPPVPAPQRQDGPGTKGVAKRSGSPARQHEHKHCRSRLTPLRNSRPRT
jgi:transposase